MGEGTNVSWQLPTWIESMVLVGALARLGAVQNPMLPIYREREVGFITKQTGAKLLVVPSVWRDFDFEAMARGIAADVPGLEVLVCDKSLPDGDPSTLGPPAKGADEPFAEGWRPTVPGAGSSTPRARPRTRRGRGTPTRPSVRPRTR